MGEMKTSSLLLPIRFAAALSAAFLCLSVSAEVGRPAKSDIPHVDRSFIEKAAKAGMEEVDAARVATERSSNPQVRDLASMLLNDHESANATLATIAAANGVSIPARDMDTTKKWMKKDSKDFDHDYLAKTVSDHEDAVKLFQNEAKDGKDDETVAFARKVLPKLEHHLQMANDLKKALK